MREERGALKENEEEIELNLELSLGKSCGKLDKGNHFEKKDEGQNISNVNYSVLGFEFESGNLNEYKHVDVHKKREIHEVIRSEEVCKKLKGDKLILGAHLDINLSPSAVQSWGNKNEENVLQAAEARCEKTAVSDDQRGGTNNNTGSNSSSLSLLQNQGASRKSGPYQHSEGNDSSCSPTQIKPSTENSKPGAHSDQTNPPTSKETSGSGRLTEPTPKQKPDLASLERMPCVSTTGNGPNGRTINGFLYKYTKSEVSIMCVCHGSSYSPAEFVEHAGGVDILYPMRHITVVPSLSG